MSCWSHLGNVGQNIANKSPNLTLGILDIEISELIKATQLFEINERSDNSPAKAIYIEIRGKTIKSIKIMVKGFNYKKWLKDWLPSLL